MTDPMPAEAAPPAFGGSSRRGPPTRRAGPLPRAGRRADGSVPSSTGRDRAGDRAAGGLVRHPCRDPGGRTPLRGVGGRPRRRDDALARLRVSWSSPGPPRSMSHSRSPICSDPGCCSSSSSPGAWRSGSCSARARCPGRGPSSSRGRSPWAPSAAWPSATGSSDAPIPPTRSSSGSPGWEGASWSSSRPRGSPGTASSGRSWWRSPRPWSRRRSRWPSTSRRKPWRAARSCGCSTRRTSAPGSAASSRRPNGVAALLLPPAMVLAAALVLAPRWSPRLRALAALGLVPIVPAPVLHLQQDGLRRRLRVRRRRGLAHPALAGGGRAGGGTRRRRPGAPLVPRAARLGGGRRLGEDGRHPRRERRAALHGVGCLDPDVRRPTGHGLGLPQLPRHRRPVRRHGPQLAPQRVAAVLRGAGDRGWARRARPRPDGPGTAGARARLAGDRDPGRVPVLRDRGLVQQPAPVHPGLDRRVHDRRHRLGLGQQLAVAPPG